MPREPLFPPMEIDREKNFIRDYLTCGLFPNCPLPEIPADLDWERLARLLAGYRLTSHFLVLGSDQQPRWDRAFLDALKRDRYSAMFYGDQCATYVRQLLQALTAADIPVIVLKGWEFITTIYHGDHSQRVCEDIDILVRSCDVDAVEALLAQLDFKMEMESWQGYNRRYWNGARYFAPVPAGMPASEFSVGLHWGLWHTPAYDAKLIEMDALFERARPLEVAGVPVLRLAVEDEIVYLSAHTRLHHFFEEALFRYYELAAVILDAGDAVAWEQVLARARRWGVVLSLRAMLEKLDALWTEILPQSVLMALRESKPTGLERFTIFWIRVTGANSALMHLLYWLTFPIWWQRGLIVLQDIFPSPAYLRHRYGQAPGGVWGLLYFRRFFHALRFLFR